MEKGETFRKELEDNKRQLRSVEIEIDRLSKQTPSLEEKVRLAEQKNIQEQTDLGHDPLDIEPSKEIHLATKTLEENRRVLEKFTARKTEILAKIESLQVSLLEDELVQQAKLYAKPKEQDGYHQKSNSFI